MSTTLMGTFGKTAPKESTTVPVIFPEEPTPCARATFAVNSKHTKIRTSDFIGFSLRMREDVDELAWVFHSGLTQLAKNRAKTVG
jgi:hypothetical protein